MCLVSATTRDANTSVLDALAYHFAFWCVLMTANREHQHTLLQKVTEALLPCVDYLAALLLSVMSDGGWWDMVDFPKSLHGHTGYLCRGILAMQC